MNVSERDLVQAIESSLHVYPPVAGLSDDLGIAGVRGRMTKCSHPLANLVGLADLTSADVSAIIARVRGRYATEGKAFGWMTGPLTRPNDLGRSLIAAGLAEADAIAGMALMDLGTPLAANPAVRIREVGQKEIVAASDMTARAYGLPPEVARFFSELLFAAGDRVPSRGYFAYLDRDEPIGWSFLVYLPHSPIALLGGAATLPEHRGRGVYTSLVARRLADARRDGKQALVIQADRTTSAPICAKLGFRELCALTMYEWTPPAA